MPLWRHLSESLIAASAKGTQIYKCKWALPIDRLFYPDIILASALKHKIYSKNFLIKFSSKAFFFFFASVYLLSKE